jgi:histidinol-phosphate aminotransferase
MIKPPPYVSDIKPYVPGKPVEELEREMGIRESVKLASNENPLGPSEGAYRAVFDILSAPGGAETFSRYPDGSGYRIKQALSKRLSIREEEIILGNGSNELIDIAVRTYLRPGDEAVMADPSFVVYPMSVKAAGGRAVQIPLKEYRHDLDAMVDAVTPNTKMVFIANPNNPTGTINTRQEFERFMQKLPEGLLLIVDEAYCEYVSDVNYADSMRYFREGRDILVLRTFSKIYGLAGLRIGYGFAQSEIVSEMNKLRPPFNTSSIAQIAALRALDDEAHVRNSRQSNEEGKQYLCRELASLGLPYVPTEANFLYMPVPYDAAWLYDALLKKGVIIRPVGPKEIRITIGLPEENRRFIGALQSVVQGVTAGTED